MKRLRAQSVLDDSSFAQNWALSRFDRGYGPKRIEQELKAKGVVPPLIRDVICKTFNQEDEKGKARLLLDKRFKGHNLSDPKILRRAATFLQRRGFSSQVVFELLGHPVQEES